MKTNAAPKPAPVYTHEGGKARRINPEEQLKRLTACCFLGENTFYVEGVEIEKAIIEAVQHVNGAFARDWAIEVRSKWFMRHAPLLIIVSMLKKHKEFVADAITGCVQRPDEMGELVSLYWKLNGKKMLPRQMRKGLAKCFHKFDEQKLSKWDFSNAAVKLRDVMFLVYPKSKSEEQVALFKKIADNKLDSVDNWETALSAGKDKKETFTRLILEERLGGMALLRNLRNMEQAKVDPVVISGAIKNMSTRYILPFRFIAAAKFGPRYEPELEDAMKRSIDGKEKLAGRTAFLVDTSGSMDAPLSAKSDLKRFEAGFGMAMVLRWACEAVDIFSFSDRLIGVPPRSGFALRDALNSVNMRGGTRLGAAVQVVLQQGVFYDRLIVITDEQTEDKVPQHLPVKNCYMVNVAGYQNGVGYNGSWHNISGFSEGVLGYIREIERINETSIVSSPAPVGEA